MNLLIYTYDFSSELSEQIDFLKICIYFESHRVFKWSPNVLGILRLSFF